MSAFLIFFFFVVTLVSQNNDWFDFSGDFNSGLADRDGFLGRQRRKIREFLRAHPLHEPYRCIDTTFFSEQEILSASLDKLTYCRYDEVLQAYHNDNPWEKTRPGYKGIHTVSVSTKQGAILIRVSDGQRAELLVRWINGKKAGNGTVQLEELDNWSIKTRF